MMVPCNLFFVCYIILSIFGFIELASGLAWYINPIYGIASTGVPYNLSVHVGEHPQDAVADFVWRHRSEIGNTTEMFFLITTHICPTITKLSDNAGRLGCDGGNVSKFIQNIDFSELKLARYPINNDVDFSTSFVIRSAYSVQFYVGIICEYLHCHSEFSMRDYIESRVSLVLAANNSSSVLHLDPSMQELAHSIANKDIVAFLPLQLPEGVSFLLVLFANEMEKHRYQPWLERFRWIHSHFLDYPTFISIREQVQHQLTHPGSWRTNCVAGPDTELIDQLRFEADLGGNAFDDGFDGCLSFARRAGLRWRVSPQFIARKLASEALRTQSVYPVHLVDSKGGAEAELGGIPGISSTCASVAVYVISPSESDIPRAIITTAERAGCHELMLVCPITVQHKSSAHAVTAVKSLTLALSHFIKNTPLNVITAVVFGEPAEWVYQNYGVSLGLQPSIATAWEGQGIQVPRMLVESGLLVSLAERAESLDTELSTTTTTTGMPSLSTGCGNYTTVRANSTRNIFLISLGVDYTSSIAWSRLCTRLVLLNEGYSVIVMQDGDVDMFLQELHPTHHRNDVLRQIPLAEWRADFIRYLLLYSFGGTYMDIDLKPILGVDDIWEIALAYRIQSDTAVPVHLLTAAPVHLLTIAANEPDELYNGFIATRVIGSPFYLHLAEMVVHDCIIPQSSGLLPHYGVNTRRFFAELQAKLNNPRRLAGGNTVINEFTQTDDVYFLREWRISEDGWGRYVLKACANTTISYGNGDRNWPPRPASGRDSRGGG